MDINSIVSGGLSGTILAVFYVIYKIAKKSKCRSRCCGYESSMSMEMSGTNSASSSLERPIIAV